MANKKNCLLHRPENRQYKQQKLLLLQHFLPNLLTFKKDIILTKKKRPRIWAALRKEVPPKVYNYGLLCGFALFLCPVSLE